MKKSASRLRRSIRYEAARIMAEDGIRDFRKAKRKACERVGVSSDHSVPTNLEIEDSLEEHLSIFSGDELQEQHRQYLEVAYEIMQWFDGCSPRLTGAAVSGTITSVRPVELQVFPDTFEEVGATLEMYDIDYGLMEKRMRFQRDGYRNVPGYEFHHDDIDVEVTVYLPGDSYPPLSRINGKPVKWNSLKKVRRTLNL